MLFRSKPIRFEILLGHLQSIYQSLASYKEEIVQKEWGFKEAMKPVKRRRKRKTAHAQKEGKPAVKKEDLRLAQKPVEKGGRMPEEISMPVVAQEVQKVTIDAPVKNIFSVEPERKATSPRFSAPTPPLPSPLAETEERVSTTFSEASTSTSPTNPSIEPAQTITRARNSKLTGLKQRHMAIYEQIFAEHWRDAKNLTLGAVEKLVKKLGGYLQGAGGSRTRIFFNNKSVATIEHRHGKDGAGTLDKHSISLLQRGLGIADFAPPGWEDELSRVRDLIINFRDYAAQRNAKKGAKV